MTDLEQQIPGTETVYVRLPSQLVMLLDMECARRRLRRPAAIAIAVESWLAASGAAKNQASSQQPLGSDKLPITEAEKWSDILRVLERIDGRLTQLEEESERADGSGDQATQAGIATKAGLAESRGKEVLAATEAAKAEHARGRSNPPRGQKRTG